ncbi:MAG: hypothetical protein N2556_02415 [Anaerolineae bacterium]|nr:hypothetical protein [Anaerolineae bacterium]
MSDSARESLVRGIAAAEAGEKEEARRYLEQVQWCNPTWEQRMEAWLWLSRISDNPAEKRAYLENVLAVDPTHSEARRELAILQGRLKPEEVIDPNRFTIAAPAEPQPAQAREFACPRCGGRIVYDPQGQLACEYCGQRPIPSTGTAAKGWSITEQDFILTLATAKGHTRPVATRCLRCNSCGASFILPPETLSFVCPYCDSSLALEQAEMQELVPPAAMVLFSLNQDQVKQIIARWVQAEKLTNAVRVTPLVGVYFPVWTFDIWSTFVERSEDDQCLPEREISLINDVPVPASRSLPESLANAVCYFDPAGLIPYQEHYLAGWMATTYQISPADASLIARQKVIASLRGLGKVMLSVESCKLILLPLWIGRCREKGQRYTIIVHDQARTVHTNRPERKGPRWLSWLMEG